MYICSEISARNDRAILISVFPSHSHMEIYNDSLTQPNPKMISLYLEARKVIDNE